MASCKLRKTALYSAVFCCSILANQSNAFAEPVNPPPTPSASDSVPPPVDVDFPVDLRVTDGQFDINVNDISIGDMKLTRFARQAGYPNKGVYGLPMSNNFDVYIAGFSQSESPGAGSILPNPSPTQYYTPPICSGSLAQRFRYTVHIGNSASGAYTEDLPNQTVQGCGGVYGANSDSLSGILTDIAGITAFGAGSGNFQYIDKGGTIYQFNSGFSATAYSQVNGSLDPVSTRASAITFPDGKVRNFQYDANGRIKLVTDTSGYGILFDNNSNGYAADACGIDLARTYVTSSSTCAGQTLIVQYGYSTVTIPPESPGYPGTPDVVLTSVTDVLGLTTNYSYNTTVDGSSEVAIHIMCIMPPGYTSCKSQINIGTPSDSTISNEVLEDGTSWTFSSEGWSNSLEGVPIGSLWFKDPLGNKTTFAFTHNSITSVTDPNNNTTNYTWGGGLIQETTTPQYQNQGSLRLSVTYPEGDSYQAYYLGPFNSISKEIWVPKSSSSLNSRVVTYQYTAGWDGFSLYLGTATYQNAAKPIARIDENGNETDWTYTAFGGVASEMKPAPASGAARPLKLFTYAQMYAYVLNSSGALVQAASPIWKPVTETECQTSAGSNSLVCDSQAPQKVATYLYGANGTADNLLLHGMKQTVGSTSLLTCYSYDQWSHKISQTSANANLTSCP